MRNSWFACQWYVWAFPKKVDTDKSNLLIS
jgi:hypothetical protein